MTTTIADIQARNRAAGGKFFSRAAMRSFNSHILPEVYEGAGGIYFVTSERYARQPRHFTVRTFNPKNDHIWTPYIEGQQTKQLCELDAKSLAAELAKRGY